MWAPHIQYPSSVTATQRVKDPVRLKLDMNNRGTLQCLSISSQLPKISSEQRARGHTQPVSIEEELSVCKHQHTHSTQSHCVTRLQIHAPQQQAAPQSRKWTEAHEEPHMSQYRISLRNLGWGMNRTGCFMTEQNNHATVEPGVCLCVPYIQ